MYTFWKRTSPPPTLSTLMRRIGRCARCGVADEHALQALVLWNDPTYVEASRKMAERVMTDAEAGATTESRLTFAFRLATARMPTAGGSAVLKRCMHRNWMGIDNSKRRRSCWGGRGGEEWVADQGEAGGVDDGLQHGFEPG